MEICEQCKCETEIVVEKGDVTCTACGLVLQSRSIDDRAEWRNAMPDESFFTGQDADSQSSYFTQSYGFAIITDLADRLSLVTLIKNSAFEIYENLYERKLHNGNDIPTLAACICIACQQHDLARTKMEICAAVDGLELHHLSKAEARIKRFLANDEYSGVLSSSKPAALINRFGSLLNLDFITKRRVKNAVLRCEEESTSHMPETMVASVIYLINKRFNRKFNRKSLLQEIVLVTGVKEGTIKSAAKRFENVI